MPTGLMEGGRYFARFFVDEKRILIESCDENISEGRIAESPIFRDGILTDFPRFPITGPISP